MVLAEELLCKFPEVLVEGSGEHQIAVVIILVKIFLKLATLKRIKVGLRAPWQTLTSSRHDFLKLFLPVGFEHLIRLVNDGVPGTSLVSNTCMDAYQVNCNHT